MEVDMGEIIRVRNIKVENLKNVVHGEIDFPKYDPNGDNSVVTGLYGQNGSGKTAAVKAFRIIQRLFYGNPYKDFEHLINVKKLFMRITITFNVFKDNIEKEIIYSAKITRGTLTLEESLSIKVPGSEKVTYHFPDDQKVLMTPNTRVHELGITKQNNIKFYVAKALSYQLKTSFIFGKNFINELVPLIQNEHLKSSILTLRNFVRNKSLLIVETARSAESALNLRMPLAIQYVDDEGYDNYLDVQLGFGLNSYDNEQITPIKKGIEKINIVLDSIIPGLSILFDDQNKVTDGFKTKFRLLAKRDNEVFPLEDESDGIKKLISFLTTLMYMYNNKNAMVVIDEFDASVFEYLLGELLQVLSEGGLGQLFFTSHNLRPLEVLKANEIYFTTTNPQKRYIKFRHVREHSNLRDFYFRTIKLGGQNEIIYDETEQYKIRNAFYTAGIQNE